MTSANMMSPEGSDYSYAEDVRVPNRLVKAVRAKALDELQVEVDPGVILRQASQTFRSSSIHLWKMQSVIKSSAPEA